MKWLVLVLALLGHAAVANCQVSFGFGQKDISVSVAQNTIEKNLETQRFVWADVGPVLVSFVGINHGKPGGWEPLRSHPSARTPTLRRGSGLR